jgi:hypothetical protein
VSSKIEDHNTIWYYNSKLRQISSPFSPQKCCIPSDKFACSKRFALPRWVSSATVLHCTFSFAAFLCVTWCHKQSKSYIKLKVEALGDWWLVKLYTKQKQQSWNTTKKNSHKHLPFCSTAVCFTHSLSYIVLSFCSGFLFRFVFYTIFNNFLVCDIIAGNPESGHTAYFYI